MAKENYEIAPADGAADLFKFTWQEVVRDIAILLATVPVLYLALVLFMQLGEICH